MAHKNKNFLDEARQLIGAASDLKDFALQATKAAKAGEEERDAALWELRWQILHLNPTVVEDQALTLQIMLDGGVDKGECYQRIAEMLETLSAHPNQLVMVANGGDIGSFAEGPFLTHRDGSVLTFDPPDHGGEGDNRWMKAGGVVQNLRFWVCKQPLVTAEPFGYLTLRGDYFLRGGNLRLIFEKELASLLKGDKIPSYQAKKVWVQSNALGHPLKAGPVLASEIQSEREKLVANLIQAFKKASDALDAIKSKQDYAYQSVELGKEKVTAIPGGIEVRFHHECAQLKDSRKLLTHLLAEARSLRMDTEAPSKLLPEAERYLIRISEVLGD